MKVWINSTELSEELSDVDTGFIDLHYVEEPTEENYPLGSIAASPDKSIVWLCSGEMGNTQTIEEAKRIIENMIESKE